MQQLTHRGRLLQRRRILHERQLLPQRRPARSMRRDGDVGHSSASGVDDRRLLVRGTGDDVV